MRRFTFIFLFFLVSFLIVTSFSVKRKKEFFHKIPLQTLNLDSIIRDSNIHEKFTISEFEISDFITLKSYKEYLNAVLKDSGVVYYKSQLPDSLMASQSTLKEYITQRKYEHEPVIGISWQNARNYCVWKTSADFPNSMNDTNSYYYRLPLASEWVAAYTYFKTQNH